MNISVPIAAFKSNCHRIIQQAQNNRQQVILTKNGKPIATVVPNTIKESKASISGMLASKASIRGDIMNTDIIWDADNE